ncbi:MAG: Cupin 2 conserved barrel domain protein [Labilithrix sp.]|nr:Cupin 2 conserved barrel domain protein [Labilithrix sp.]
MYLIRKEQAPVFTLGGLTVNGLASPKRGASETCVWRIELAPKTAGVAHRVTREEVFVGVAGEAVVTIAGTDHRLGAGDAVIVPADTLFALANHSEQPFEAIAALPVGGKAVTDGAPFSPPWVE